MVPASRTLVTQRSRTLPLEKQAPQLNPKLHYLDADNEYGPL